MIPILPTYCQVAKTITFIAVLNISRFGIKSVKKL